MEAIISCLFDLILYVPFRIFHLNRDGISEGWREPLEHIPEEKHHRSQHLVRHMREVEERGMHIFQSAINSLGESMFDVKMED